MELARDLHHPFTLAYTLFHVGFLELWRGRWERVGELATDILETAEEHDYRIWNALALVLQGVALTGLGREGVSLASSAEPPCTKV